MNCAEFDTELNQILDRRAGDELATLQPHAEQCAPCRQALEQARTLVEAIGLWRGAVPEVDLVSAVVLACAEAPNGPVGGNAGHRANRGTGGSHQRLETPSPSGTSRRSRTAVYGALVALSSMLLVAIFLTTRDSVSPTVVEREARSQRAVPSRDRREDPELAIFDQAGDAYGRLAKSAAGALEEFAVIVIPGAGGSVSSGRSSQSADEPLLEGLQQQLQPIGRSLGDALDFLWEVGAPPADSQT